MAAARTDVVTSPRDRVFVVAAVDEALASTVRERGLEPVAYANDQALDSGRALVVFVTGTDRGAIRAEATPYAARAFDAGIDLVLLAKPESLVHADAVARSLIAEADLEGEKAGAAREARFLIEPNSAIAFSTDALDAATNHITKLNPRFRAVASLDIVGELKDKEHRQWLGMAFFDAVQLTVSPLPGGRVASGMYRVIAKLKTGSTPLPFAAKIDLRTNILAELGNNVLHVRDYVPFTHRPNVLITRCHVGFKFGILVTNFVSRSESLSRAVARDGATRAIHSLFGVATTGWWSQSFQRGVVRNQLLANLTEWYRPASSTRQRALAEYAAIATTQHGTPADAIAQIQQRLDDLPPVDHWRGRVHGDLNDGNVCVQGDLPHLIDFNATAEGPLLADPATLEVSLISELGLRSCEPPTSGSAPPPPTKVDEAWAALADRLYDPATLQRPLPACSPPSIVRPLDEHYWAAIHAIRLHAFSLETSPNQYRVLLAACLMRFASFSRRKRERFVCAWAVDRAWQLVQP